MKKNRFDLFCINLTSITVYIHLITFLTNFANGYDNTLLFNNTKIKKIEQKKEVVSLKQTELSNNGMLFVY